MKPARLSALYLLLACAGLAVTWYFNLRYMQAGGTFDPATFWHHAFANDLTAAMSLDVYLAALAFSVWVFREARRTGMRRPWLYVLLCFFGALACALPLFLAMRERALASASSQHA
jgi:hypothetical protein